MAAPVVESYVSLAVTSASVSITINKPTGTVDGDLLVFFGFPGVVGATSPTAPSGWSTVYQQTGTGTRFFMFWKIASGEGANFTFNWSGSSELLGEILRISGADATTPINVQDAAQSPGFSASIICPTVTTTVANCLLLTVAVHQNGSGITFTPPNTSIVAATSATSGSNGVAASISREDVASSGATGTRTVTASASARWHGISVAIAPAAAPTTSTGTMAGTEGADAAAFAGDVIVQGTLWGLEGPDSAASVGDVFVRGALAATEGADAAAFTGGGFLGGTLAVVEGADTAAFTGDVFTQGTLAATEGADIAAFAGDVFVVGVLAATEVADMAAMAGVVRVSGALAGAEGADIAALSGLVLQVVYVDLAATEGADIPAFAGTVRNRSQWVLQWEEVADYLTFDDISYRLLLGADDQPLMGGDGQHLYGVAG